ncbi:MAG: hypothetical protein ACK5AO_02700 [bacterium]
MRDYSTEEFEDILREKSQQYMVYPSDRVWDNILNKLHPLRRIKNIAFLLLFFTAATTAIVLSSEEAKYAMNNSEKITANLISKQKLTVAQSATVNIKEKTVQPLQKNNIVPVPIAEDQKTAAPRQIAQLEPARKKYSFNIPSQISSINYTIPIITSADKVPAEKTDADHQHASTIIENVIEKATKIKKNARWQYYVTPTISYRSLSGQASKTTYQYSQYFMSTNAPFATDVKDAVNHRPGIGLEIGTSMFYTITKRLSFKMGIQGNYNHYQIKAFSSVPEIATYGMNNFSGATIPINAVSVYRNNTDYSNATLRNEHYMISIPIGFDYRLLGNKKVNLSVASSIQPTYVFANYSYLISTNLKNYAKEPSLNRNLNINGAIEASLNITSGSLKWSIAPQYRYQMISSFKNKYPIRENLMDFGIKFGVIKSIN